MELRRGWRPGVIGEIVRAHGLYYSREWAFGAFFEAKVAEELASFVARLDPARDLLLTAWSAENDFRASLVIDGSDTTLPEGVSHLRWFVATDAARGAGVGGRMMAEAMGFLRTAGYTSCYLTTFAGLDAARRLYETHGFRLVDERVGESWGVEVGEQRFEMEISTDV